MSFYPTFINENNFDTPIGEFQFIQGKIADMYTTLAASRAFLYQIAWNCDHGLINRKDAAVSFFLPLKKATLMALEAIQMLGGNGYINEYPTGRLLRDAKLYEIGAGNF